jgi:hypothetical protein
MGGRGTWAAGISVPPTYKQVSEIGGIKVLEGIGDEHGLPFESHTSNAYVKLRPDGSFHTLRVYDDKHRISLEIANHPEKDLALKYGLDRSKPILHVHHYDFTKSKFRSDAELISPNLKKRYQSIWKGR